MTPLDQIKIPALLNPAEACRLASLLTGHKQLKPIDKYIALGLLNVSWRSSAPFSMRAFMLKLMMAQRETNFQLLESLANRTIYEEAGKANGLADALVQEVLEAVERWNRQLAFARPSAQELHALALGVIESLLNEEQELQAEAAITIQKITSLAMKRYQDTKAEEAATCQATEVPQTSAEPCSGVVVRTSQSNGEVLACLIAALGRADTVRSPEAASEEVTPGPVYKVYDPAEAARLREQAGPAMFGEGNQKQSRVLEALSAGKGLRSLVTVERIEESMAVLAKKFPHFQEVLDFIKSSLYLASCGRGPAAVRIPPILLRGMPGCGKSYFAEELAKVLNAPYVERDLSVTSEAFVLVGQDSTWKNSKPGLVFETIINGQYANPVICLNEVDKVKSSGNVNSPMSALYGLLEPSTAKTFKDEFVPLSLDASRVIWVLTANDGDIPEPILSRVEVFDIPEPTDVQMKEIAKSIWSSIRETELPDGNLFEEHLGEDVLQKLPQVSPRVLRKLLISAAAYACMPGGPRQLTSEGLRESALRYKKHAMKTKVGFI